MTKYCCELKLLRRHMYWQTRKPHKILVGKHHGKFPHGRQQWEVTGNIKINFMDAACSLWYELNEYGIMGFLIMNDQITTNCYWVYVKLTRAGAMLMRPWSSSSVTLRTLWRATTARVLRPSSPWIAHPTVTHSELSRQHIATNCVKRDICE